MIRKRFVSPHRVFVCVVYVVAFVAPAFLFAQAPPKRIISLVPNVTEMLFAIGAGPQVVAVSNYDVEPPAVRSLPTVGALLDPDTEKIIAALEGLTIDAPRGKATLRKEDHQAFCREFVYDLKNVKHRLNSTI